MRFVDGKFELFYTYRVHGWNDHMITPSRGMSFHDQLRGRGEKMACGQDTIMLVNLKVAIIARDLR